MGLVGLTDDSVQLSVQLTEVAYMSSDLVAAILFC